ncbi:MAG: Uma2 family endonuclease [Planctomycetota bacterium]
MATTLLDKPQAPPVPLYSEPGMTGHPPVEMPYADFLENKGLPHGHFEYVEGRAVELPAVSDAHDQLTNWLIMTLGPFVHHRKLGQVKSEPFTIHIPSTDNGRSPDVMVVLNDNLKHVEQNQLNGPADLVIEVLSRSTARVDRRAKHQEYQAAGVREYWMVHPLREQFEPFVLEEGRFVPSVPDEDDVYHSAAVPGLWYRLEWFLQRPDPVELLKAWKIV